MSLPNYPKYKDSEAAWLGKVPTHWDVSRLKLVVRLITEKTDRRSYPVALENIEGWSGKFIPTETEFEGEGVAFEPGDVLFGKLRPYLAKAYLADSTGEAVGDFHVLRPTAKLVPRFLQYQVLSQNFIAMVDGSTFGSRMPRVSWEFLANMMLAVPSRDEQLTVANFLDREAGKIDALIAEQEKLLTLLAEKRQATISQSVTRGLNPDVPMKDSGVEWLGRVPEHWVSKRLGLLFRQRKRQGFLDKEVLSVYRDLGVIRKDSRTDNFNKTPEDLSAYQLVEAGNLVVNKMKAWQGSLGISSLEGITSPDYIVFEPHHAEVPEYLHFLLRAKPMVSTYRSISNGIRLAQWRLEPDAFLSLKVFLPPTDEQQVIAGFIRVEVLKIDALVAEAEKAIELLNERRSALIAAAVTGKIDVRDAVLRELAA